MRFLNALAGLAKVRSDRADGRGLATAMRPSCGTSGGRGVSGRRVNGGANAGEEAAAPPPPRQLPRPIC
jgi:hypothetical protein